jgi:hypothetical protein
MSEIYNKCFEELVKVSDKKITLLNIVNVITRSIEIVEKYTHLTGLEKKSVVVNMVSSLIENHEEDEETKKSLVDFTNTVGLTIIDTIIYVANGKLAINIHKTVTCLKKWKCF